MDLNNEAINAVKYNDEKMLNKLVDQGHNLKEVHDWKHWTLVHFAAYANNVNMLYYLHGLGLDLDHSHYGDATPLYVTAISDAADAALYLIQMGCDINKKRTLNGYTPFFVAAWNNSLKVMKVLKDNNCDLSLESNDSFRKETPAFIAARWGKLGALRLLHSYGCDITSCNADGNTPEFIAYHFGNNDCGDFIAEVTSDTYSTETTSESIIDNISESIQSR